MKTAKKTETKKITGMEPAVRRGAIYCAPWCGAGCTKKAYDAAVKAANAMVKALNSNWIPDVWENLGWHSGVVSKDGNMKVILSIWKKQKTYSAYINGGKYAFTASTPRKAVQGALNLFNIELDRLNEISQKCNKAL